jgi:hypothetical protein
MHGPYAISRGVNATVDHVEDQQAIPSVQYIYHTVRHHLIFIPIH